MQELFWYVVDSAYYFMLRTNISNPLEWLLSKKKRKEGLIKIEETETFVHCCWECKTAQLQQKTVWKFLQKAHIKLPYDLTILLLSMYSWSLSNVAVGVLTPLPPPTQPKNLHIVISPSKTKTLVTDTQGQEAERVWIESVLQP